MSPDQDPEDSDAGADIDEVLRAAEQAVDQVRGSESDDAEDPPDLGEQLAAAQAEAAALKDKWLRAIADLDNYKKRVKRDIDDAVHRATQGLLGSFLPVGDNLERALSVAPSEPDEQLSPLIKGLEMVRQEFFSALAKHNIKPIESIGQLFDPNVHDALQQTDSPDHAPGVVVMEYEKGYLRGEKLLRPARVIVAGPGSTGKPADANPDSAAGGASGEETSEAN
ncbi:heat shock protein GrpE [Enhygromyxa salina]|uniref:Protein GrpE n=1 Tax=Enhygromyxa salina TaxID=215803 RepID=A0A2S9XHY1_9BACT|nr:nucleotide exchange factor GrpE [Enhygromyxa salina]PRP92472.1 heat shock protein GrpE [Enhygromyxa salina]